MKKTLYEIVGVARDATPEALAEAARVRMEALKRAHLAGDANAGTESFALKEAFSVLRDPVKRAAYDQKLDLAAGSDARRSTGRYGAFASGAAGAGADAAPIIYAADTGKDPLPAWVEIVLLLVVAVVMAYWIGKSSYQAEERLLIATETDNIRNFNVATWVRSLGPAKGDMIPASAQRDPTAPDSQAFSLEEFERQKEARDQALRRTMERERREYDASRRRAEQQTERENARALNRYR